MKYLKKKKKKTRRKAFLNSKIIKHNVRKKKNAPYIYLEQIENLDTELIVKISITGVGHVVNKYEPIPLSLNTIKKWRSLQLKSKINVLKNTLLSIIIPVFHLVILYF